MPERRRPVVDPSPALRAVAAHGLSGSSLTVPSGPLDSATWADLLGRAGRQRLIGLLAACVADGTLAVTDAQHDEVAHEHATVMERILDIESAALDAIGTLGDAGVHVRVLKGLAVSHLDLPDPSQREFGDADLLVEPGAFGRAIEVLTAAGLPRDLPERRAGFDRRFGKEATLYGPRGIEIDLHRTLALGAFGLALDPATLWDDGEQFLIGGHPLLALTPEARLLHACYSAMLGDPVPRVVALRDIAGLAGRPGLAAGMVIRLAERGRGAIVVARALRLAGDTLGLGPGWPEWDWAPTRPEPRWERVALAAYESHGGTNTTTLLSGLLAIKGAGPKLSYGRALVFPDRAYRRARRRAGRPSEWGRGLRELARLSSRRVRRRP